MSSTQWGMWESGCAEGAVAGGLWAASATASATLWAPANGIGGHSLCKAAEWCARKSICPFTPENAKKHGLKSRRREYELFLFALPPTLYWV